MFVANKTDQKPVQQLMAVHVLLPLGLPQTLLQLPGAHAAFRAAAGIRLWGNCEQPFLDSATALGE